MTSSVMDGNQSLLAGQRSEGSRVPRICEFKESAVKDLFWQELDEIIASAGLAVVDCREPEYEGKRFEGWGAAVIFTMEQRYDGKTAWGSVDLLKFVMRSTVVQRCKEEIASNPGKALTWVWYRRPDLKSVWEQSRDIEFNSMMYFLIQVWE